MFNIDNYNESLLNKNLDKIDDNDKEYDRQSAYEKVCDVLSEKGLILDLLERNDYITKEEIELYYEGLRIWK